MKRFYLFLTLALMMFCLNVNAEATVGQLKGAFTVNGAGKRVWFSRGNLQYQASTDTWRFAENQYDYIGNAAGNNTAAGSRDTQSAWIDLFGWGTANNPTITTGNSTFTDWGINAISNGGNTNNLWRTLTKDEWEYLLKTRSVSRRRYAWAEVNGINGVILFPDDWATDFTAGTIVSLSDWVNNYEAKGTVFLPAAGYRSGTTVSSAGGCCYYWFNAKDGSGNAYRYYSTGGEDLGYRTPNNGASVRLVCETKPYGVATFIVSPTANILTYNGNNQELITAGSSDVGIVYYRLGDGEWTTEIPTASAPGTYSVYYKIIADVNHDDNEDFEPIIVVINKPAESAPVDVGQLKGAFSVSGSSTDTVKLHFSRGNLQYQASTDTWRFAENQYDYIGNAAGNNTAAGSRDTQSAWIDLFGWGTGDNPTNVSTNSNDYSTFVDWGTNAISNGGNTGDVWRTPSLQELRFLFNTRKNAQKLRGLAKITIDNVLYKGMIVLPDDWSAPNASIATKWAECAVSASAVSYELATFTEEEWRLMENKGAVFLPAGGYRIGADINDAGTICRYWSSSAHPSSSSSSACISFNSANLYIGVYYSCHYGFSVRPMCLPNIATTPATIIEVPTAKSLTYNTQNQELITAGSSNEGLVYYKLGNGSWSLEIPTASAPGTYTVYYKIVGDGRHSDNEDFEPINVAINKPESAPAEVGQLKGAFSVCVFGTDTFKMHFSRGNLQYQASTDTWRFAENQYDYVGDDTMGNVYVGEEKCNNANISDSYTGWIDLFGWGTGDTPTESSTSSSAYSTFVDWGTNAISNGGNTGDVWRTPTSEELSFLLETRKNAQKLRGLAKITIDDVLYCGMIVLPDNWSAPNASIASKWAECAVSVSALNYTRATFTQEEWLDMESAGAVFLPSGGIRSGSTFSQADQGNYWTATSETYLDFDPGNLRPQGYAGNYWGFTVRLMCLPDVIPATLIEVPYANILTYSGAAQELVTAGSASGGSVYYKLGDGAWTLEIPTASETGNYTVYYKVLGDAMHGDYTPEPNSINVSITKPSAVLTTVPTATNSYYNGSTQNLVSAGVAEGGMIYYSMDGTSWSTSVPAAKDAAAYDVWYKVVGDENHSDIAPTMITSTISCPSVFDNVDPSSVLSLLYNNGASPLIVNRTIWADDEYNTICLPFNVTAEDLATSTYPLYGYNRLKAFRGAQVTGTGQNLSIDILVEDVDHMDAGVPYLITYPTDRGSNIVNPFFNGITVTTTTPSAVSADGVTFKGMFGPVHISTYAENNAANNTEDYLFLGENSQLYWPNDDGTSMRGFRAYFIVDRNAIPRNNAPKGTRARIVDAPKTTTAIDNPSAKFGGSEKIIENGILYIIRNGVKYNAQGQVIK